MVSVASSNAGLRGRARRAANRLREHTKQEDDDSSSARLLLGAAEVIEDLVAALVHEEAMHAGRVREEAKLMMREGIAAEEARMRAETLELGEELKKSLDALEQLVSEHIAVKPSDYMLAPEKRAEQLQHARHSISIARQFAYPAGIARWVGFVQGVLWANRVTTLEYLKRLV